MKTWKAWTPEEHNFLLEKVGILNLNTIAKKLNRTVDAIESRMQLFEINNTKALSGRLTINELAKIINVDNHTIGKWIKKYNLKCTRKIIRTSIKYNFIEITDFWKWAEENKDKINFSRIEKGVLIPEPSWFDVESRKDYHEIPKNDKKFWTKEEDERLIEYIRMDKTYKEIAELMHRSKASIDRRLHRLREKNKKIVVKNIKIPWKDIEWEMVLEMEQKGMSDKEIAEKLGRTINEIRWKRKMLRKQGLYEGYKSRGKRNASIN